MTLKHIFVSAIPDGGDANLVQPSNWNADHTINDGTVSLPALSPASDPNTGLYFNGADFLGIATGGVQRVGVNTTRSMLEVKTAFAFTPASQMVASFADTANSFIQVGIQNASNGTAASSDLVLTTDTGTDSAEYIDLGINSSGFTGTWGLAKDGYLFVDGGASGVGDLVIGTAQANTYVDIQVGGGASTFRVCRFDNIGMIAKDGPVGGVGRSYALVRAFDFQ